MKTQHGRDLSPEEMAQMIDEYVNSHNDKEDREAFVDQVVYRTHRTLQQNVMRYVVALIEKYASLCDAEYDARNAASVRLSKKIVETTYAERFLPHI
jgi:hypothetical protein